MEALEFLKDLEEAFSEEIVPEVKPQLVKTYQYTDEKGNVLFEKLRFEPGPDGKKKTFRIRRVTTDGFEWGMTAETRRVLFNLPSILKSTLIVITEGEKDAETAIALDATGTSIYNGSQGEWLPEYTQALVGKDVVMFRDQDEPGIAFSETIQGELTGRASRFGIVDVPKGKDLTEWKDLGGTREEFYRLIEIALAPKNALLEKTTELIQKRSESNVVECEKVILGILIKGLEQPGEISCHLQPEHFSLESHQEIYKTLQELSGEGVVGDRKALVQRLSDRGILSLIGGVNYILELIDDIPPAYNIDFHLRVITEKAESRLLVNSVMGSVQDLLLGGDINAVRTEIVKALESSSSISLSRKTGPSHTTEIAGTEEDFFKPEPPGILSNLTMLNDWSDGMHQGELIVIGGRPGDGKSSLGGQLCVYAARQGHRTDILSYEETEKRCLNKLICSIAKVPYKSFRKGDINDEQKARLLGIRSKMLQMPLHIADSSRIAQWTTADIRNYIKQQIAKKDPVRVLMIDYLQLMRLPKADRHDIALGMITRDLKLICNDFGVTIILLSQLNREGEKANRKPNRSDLRDSGSIESDANTLYLIWQDRREGEQPGGYRDALIIVPKAREGPTGEIPVKFWKPYTFFVDFNYFDKNPSVDA